MNYISSFFTGSTEEEKQGESKRLSQEQLQFIQELRTKEGVFKIMGESEIEEVLCMQVGEVEFGQVIKKKDGASQQKKCEFLNSKVTFRVQDIVDKDSKDGEDISITIPCICVENESYEEDQDQMKEQFLPLSSDLIFIRYEDKYNGKRGYVFFYPSQDKTWLFESDDSSQSQIKDLDRFENIMCQLLFIIHQKRQPTEKDVKLRQQYCMQCTPDLIFKSKNLYFILGDDDDKDQDKITNIQKQEGQVLAEDLAGFTLTKSDDEVAFETVQMLIEERIIQVSGHLFKYDSDTDKNLLVAKSCFLCIDRRSGGKRHRYMFHVTDQAQKISYTRVDVEVPALNYSFSEVEKVLMWMGQPKDSSVGAEIPAWSFLLDHDHQVPRLKGVLTKVIFETNLQEDIERSVDKDEMRYIESQVLGDQERDIDMEGIYKIEDFDFMDYEASDQREEEDSEEEVSLKKPKNDLGFVDNSDDEENSESVQAQSYDRTFVVSGPVVKVYKKGDTQGARSLVYDMNLPILKNDDGLKLKPCNLMLHHSEGQMIFCDKNDESQLYNFDMEKGKVVEEFTSSKDKAMNKMRHITNAVKNGQTSVENTFVGVNDRAIYTLDPRINKKEKVAQSKVYKTNPQFNQVSTTLQGGLAIGSLNGEIRLYKEVGQNAKTLLPGLGDPIRGVNMSVDGEWLVATTQTYLLVIPTMCSNGKTGFDHRMGKEKPTPKKLQIHVKDLAKYKIRSVDFTPAKFNNFNVSGGEETSIVTSSGPFVFTWNFKKVKKGLLRSYKLTKIEGGKNQIVDSQFEFNNDEKIVVTQPKKVGVQTRSKKTLIQY